MRRRVLGLVFTTTLFAVTLLGALIIVTIWAVMGQAMQERATALADFVVGQLDDPDLTSSSVTKQALSDYGRRDHAVLTVTFADGTVVSSGSLPADESFTATAQTEESGLTVTASIPRSLLREEVLAQAGVVIGIAVLVLGVSMLVAWFYTKRLVKPLEDFARQAERLSTGDARHLGKRYGVPEIDAVAEVLDAGVIGFNALLENERRVTNDVSHQMRTPLTALSLRLEEVLAARSLEEVHEEATAALDQVERLSGVIDEVASVNRGLVGPVQPYAVDDLVDAQLVEWQPSYDAAGRGLERRGRTGRTLEGVRGRQAQVLATLLENSLAHGGGTTTVRVRESGSWVVVEVSDQGPGVPEAIEAHVFERSVSGGQSTGLGLALARTLSSADGGRLEMLSARPAVFAMFLPTQRPVDDVRDAVPDDAAVQAGPEGAADGPSLAGGVAVRAQRSQRV